MATDTLVDNQLNDGWKLLLQLAFKEFDVTAAAWLKTSEEERWFLYIVTQAVDAMGLAMAYREMYGSLPSMEFSGISFQVKLISPTSPIARDLLEIQRQTSAGIPTRTGPRSFGNVAAEEAYIYPP